MTPIDRRNFIKALAAAPAASILTIPAHAQSGQPKARVVVIGGGFGGATAAKYVKMLDPAIEVTLIEPNKVYTSCPLSNEVISGHRDLASLQTGYDGVKKRGVNVVHDLVEAVDPAKKTVRTKGGKTYAYDALVMSPGIDFKFDSVEGYSEQVAETIPHAYKAGAQTILLRQQLEAMPDGGVFIISVPPRPIRCPPGPYERAAQVAWYCKTHGKPKAKVLILDANDSHSKQALFRQAWRELYGYGKGQMIEWVPAAEDGKVVRVDPKTRTAYTSFGEHKADVLNLIPLHHAGQIAIKTGLANERGWCEVVPMTMESAVHKDIYPIGDACIAGELPVYDMPKSAHMANTQAKVAAGAIVAKLNGLPPPTPWYVNTCYSLAGENYGFSVVHIYRVENNKFVYITAAGGVSPADAAATGDKPAVKVPRIQYALEAQYLLGWWRNIMTDAFA